MRHGGSWSFRRYLDFPPSKGNNEGNKTHLLPKMPKLITPLSDKEIKNAKPKAKPYLLFDGTQAGLHVYISVVGTKSLALCEIEWVVEFHFSA